MNMKEKLPKIEKFLSTVISNEFDGTYYMPLGACALYLVACKDEEEGTIAKIAYNCDDLQCDYDLDWCMPVYKNGEVVFQSSRNIKQAKQNKQPTNSYSDCKPPIKNCKS